MCLPGLQSGRRDWFITNILLQNVTDVALEESLELGQEIKCLMLWEGFREGLAEENLYFVLPAPPQSHLLVCEGDVCTVNSGLFTLWLNPKDDEQWCCSCLFPEVGYWAHLGTALNMLTKWILRGAHSNSYSCHPSWWGKNITWCCALPTMWYTRQDANSLYIT